MSNCPNCHYLQSFCIAFSYAVALSACDMDNQVANNLNDKIERYFWKCVEQFPQLFEGISKAKIQLFLDVAMATRDLHRLLAPEAWVNPDDTTDIWN